MSADRKKHAALFVLVLAFMLMTALVHIQLDYPVFAPSPYNSYTLQAMAWRKGQTHLDMDYPHLELAIYNGRHFVSFPPFPSVPVFLLTFIFGDNVPDGMLVKLYALIALIVIFQMLLRHGFSPFKAAFWAFALCFSSSMLPLVFSGAVWYQAQVLAFLLTVAAIDLMDRERPGPGLAMFALAVGCRPFNALYGPLLMILYAIRQREKANDYRVIFLKLLPGLLIGLLVAALYGIYNFIRFGNPLEFGHSFLPEFSFQGGTQFSLGHLGKNIGEFFFTLPFEQTPDGLRLKQFGFSIFIANPILLLLIFRGAQDIVKRKLKTDQGLILTTMLVHLFLLLLHRTFGGYQYGARYAVDLIPYSLLYLIRRDGKRLNAFEAVVLVLGFIMAVLGSLIIRIQ